MKASCCGACAFVATATVASAALAANLPKEGKYDYNACFAGVTSAIAFSRTHSATSSEFTGVILSNPPNGPFDKDSFHCLSMGASFDGKQQGLTVCETVDADGDRRLSVFSTSADGKVTRETVSGTGKYEGMTMTGVSQPLGPFATVKPGTVQNCTRQTGTYKLK